MDNSSPLEIIHNQDRESDLAWSQKTALEYAPFEVLKLVHTIWACNNIDEAMLVLYNKSGMIKGLTNAIETHPGSITEWIKGMAPSGVVDALNTAWNFMMDHKIGFGVIFLVVLGLGASVAATGGIGGLFAAVGTALTGVVAIVGELATGSLALTVTAVGARLGSLGLSGTAHAVLTDMLVNPFSTLGKATSALAAVMSLGGSETAAESVGKQEASNVIVAGPEMSQSMGSVPIPTGVGSRPMLSDGGAPAYSGPAIQPNQLSGPNQ